MAQMPRFKVEYQIEKEGDDWNTKFIVARDIHFALKKFYEFANQKRIAYTEVMINPT